MYLRKRRILIMKNVLLKRKILVAGLVVSLILSSVYVLGGCSCSDKKSDGSNSLTKAITESTLNIEDFPWSVDLSKINKKDVYAFSLTNNSKYELLGAEINYKTKPGLTPEQLSVFDDFVSKRADFFKDGQTAADVILRGFGETYIGKGASVSNIPVALGVGNYSWYDIPTKEQFDLMEPNELVIVVVGNDDVAYSAYYNYADKKWRIDSRTVKLNKWPDSELAKLIPEPKEYTYKTSNSDEDDVYADVYGVNEEYYNSYIEKLKEKGFTEDIKEKTYSDSDASWEAKDKNGNEIELKYYNEKHKLDIHLEKK